MSESWPESTTAEKARYKLQGLKNDVILHPKMNASHPVKCLKDSSITSIQQGINDASLNANGLCKD